MTKKLLRKDGYLTKYGTLCAMGYIHRQISIYANPIAHYFGNEIATQMIEFLNNINSILKENNCSL